MEKSSAEKGVSFGRLRYGGHNGSWSRLRVRPRSSIRGDREAEVSGGRLSIGSLGRIVGFEPTAT
jgi:hypothetical protein